MPRDLAIWTGSGAPSTRTWRFALWYAGPTSVQVRSALTVRSAQSTEMDHGHGARFVIEFVQRSVSTGMKSA